MRVALAVTGVRHVGPLERAQSEVSVVRRAADLAELIAVARSGLVDAVLVSEEADRLGRGVLEELSGGPRPVAVVAMSEVREDRARLRALGVPCLRADVDPLALAAAVQDAVCARLTGAPPALGAEEEGDALLGEPPAPAGPAGPVGPVGRPAVAERGDADGMRDVPAPAAVRVDPVAAAELDALFAAEPGGEPTPGAAERARPATDPAAGRGSDDGSGAPDPGADERLAPAARAEAGGTEASGGEEGRVVVVWGPTGAPGRTTVAVNLAAEAALAGLRTLVVDLDTYGPAVGVHLGLADESAGVARAVRSADRGPVSPADLVEAAVRVRVAGRELDVLTGLTRPDRWPELRPGALGEVLSAARRGWDRVLVDVGFCLEEDEELSFDVPAPQRNGAALAAMDAADRVLAVGGADAVSLPRLLRALETLPESVDRTRVAVVMNRVRPQASGVSPRSQVAGVWARYGPGLPIVAQLPWDPQAADRALFGGQVLAEATPHGALRRAVADLARLDPAVAAASGGARRDGVPGRRGPRARRLMPWSAPSPRTP